MVCHMVSDSWLLCVFWHNTLQCMPWIPRHRPSADGPQRSRDCWKKFRRSEEEYCVLPVRRLCTGYVHSRHKTVNPGLTKNAAGAVLGAVFGAVLSEFVWWPWTYWVQGILLFAYAASSFLILPFDEHNPAEGSSKPTFNFAGKITGVSGLILFNSAWNQASVVGWATPYTYILLIVGIFFFGAFVYIERNLAKHPLVLIRSLSKEATYALSMIACGWASFGIWLYYLWQMFLHLRHHSPLSAAAQQVPVVISGFCASLAVGFFLARTKAPFIMVAAMTCFLVGQMILATAPIDQKYWAQTFVTSVIMPWGMDMSFPCGTIILSNGMPREHQGIAASLGKLSLRPGDPFQKEADPPVCS